jgi:hypothetical protein
MAAQQQAEVEAAMAPPAIPEPTNQPQPPANIQLPDMAEPGNLPPQQWGQLFEANPQHSFPEMNRKRRHGGEDRSTHQPSPPRHIRWRRALIFFLPVPALI